MYSSAQTHTRTSSITATAARVADVLRQVRVDLINAERAGLTSAVTIKDWVDDLTAMLLANALVHFELRILDRSARIWRAFRYTISDDGSLQEKGHGGGIDFFAAPAGSVARLTILRRPNLPPETSRLIDELGWTSPGQFVPEFEDVMNKLPINQVSDPVVSRFGVHLIEVIERRSVPVDRKQLREIARNVLREQRFDTAYADWAREIRARAYIEMREPPQ